MLDKAPIGYLSPAHLSEGDRLLAKKMVAENPTEIMFEAITLDLIVGLENVSENANNFYDDLEVLKRLGFSENFCKILVDAYNQNFYYILFHEYGPINHSYESLTDEYHVFD